MIFQYLLYLLLSYFNFIYCHPNLNLVSELHGKDEVLAGTILKTRIVSSIIQCHHVCLRQKEKCDIVNFIKNDKNGECQIVSWDKVMKTMRIPNTLNYKINKNVPSKVLKDMEETIIKKDCLEWRRSGYNNTDIYKINMTGKTVFVKCDMHTDGGGWIIFQNRFDGSVNFNRDWNSYKNGFGNLSKEFWLGNEKLHELTRNNNGSEIRIEGESFNGTTKSVAYTGFKLKNEKELYKFSLGKWKYGTGENFNNHVNKPFSTFDSNNDNSCSRYFKSGWWFANCYWMNLNGLFTLNETLQTPIGIIWIDFQGRYKSLKKTKMMIRSGLP